MKLLGIAGGLNSKELGSKSVGGVLHFYESQPASSGILTQTKVCGYHLFYKQKQLLVIF